MIEDRTIKKIANLEDIQLLNNLLTISELTKKWLHLKPDNKELQLLEKSVIELSLLCNNIIDDKLKLYKIIEDYRLDKIRAVHRARRAENKLK
tara:strand:- start:40 stop:318 length:279 start_codon:yes stop_codon:yes gene_type:complete